MEKRLVEREKISMAEKKAKAVVIFIFFLAVFSCSADEFTEEIFLKTLPTGDVYTHSQLATTAALSDQDGASHYNLFPKSLGQIIKKYNVAELHLSLTHGRWRHKLWGYPIQPAPHGAELWVWFSPKIHPESVNKKWAGLVNALSGQFCASLNYLKQDVSISPSISFLPMGLWPKGKANDSTYLRYGTLPREIVCTENLTPWKKLLPCESKELLLRDYGNIPILTTYQQTYFTANTFQAGISSLFNALNLYDSSYHSLGVSLRSVCQDKDCKSATLELKQTLASVYDRVVSNLEQGWSFGKMFGELLKYSCPLASSSKVLVDVSEGSEGNSIVNLNPKPTFYENKVIHGKPFRYAVYDLKRTDFRNLFEIKARYSDPRKPGRTSPPTIHAHRYTTGHGGERGGVVCLISNENAFEGVAVSYLDVIPWYIPVYLHTFRIEVAGRIVKADYFKFIPAKDRSRSTVIEAILSIPPRSTLKISFSFTRSSLKWTEHPPDSHHGFYMGSTVISANLPDANNLTGLSERCPSLSGSCIGRSPLFIRIHTESNLIVLPVPDFSMPYNVICLTCTIFAIGFGSMFNLATRTFTVVSSKNKPSLKDRVKDFLFGLIKSKSD